MREFPWETRKIRGKCCRRRDSAAGSAQPRVIVGLHRSEEKDRERLDNLRCAVLRGSGKWAAGTFDPIVIIGNNGTSLFFN